MYVYLIFVLIVTVALGSKISKNKGYDNNKPVKCGYNEEYVKCQTVCPPQSCDIAYTEYLCTAKTCEPGCDCIKDHLRNASNICIPNDQCPPPKIITPKPGCGPNEVRSNCKIVCPPQTCESIFRAYACDGPLRPCIAGCNCIDGYLRDANNTCIPNEQCPPAPSKPSKPKCGLNEVYSDCKIDCPPQTCESIYTSYACDGPERPCTVGYNCIDGYLRDANNTCVPSELCPPAPTQPTQPECGLDEVYSDCKIVCPPQTCESIFRSYACDGPERPCITGCNCIDGYLRDANNTCIPSDHCPTEPTLPTKPQCGENEVATDCKKVCPPQTCTSLYSKFACKDTPCESGCDCIDGYLRDANNVCIPSNKCPGVSNTICGVNETIVDCAFRCPNQNCPVDDSLIEVACKPGRPCASGCACKDGYRRKSDDDDTCVLASDCPRIECTRPNEIWDSCSSDSLLEKCEELSDRQNGIQTQNSDCRPRCVCKKNFCRDKDDICKPIKDCIKGPYCEPTCAAPNPPNCPLITKNKSSKHGSCQSGHILSKKGGTCIKIEDCPKGCNGDPNAIAKICPAGCPSTCDKPNALPCSKQCEPLGCECAYGYLRSKVNGKCISSQECPGGNPCSVNETFVPCKSGCPTDYCPTDDSRGVVICETYPFSPCFSGCICKLNHKRLSTKDDRCIVSSECPPVNCTRPNEEWNPCPSDCQSEYCDSANKEPVTCNTLLLNCQPRCTCKKNHYRNTDDICIPASDCPKNE
ncbi:cell death abnormality protein 1-like isoform X2 [Amyelois transitella]|uniref:cell death abnormality protein 1-like isoform X2 n=1 Tax=Amyelois transitella TaxID=680683 RepID=UPI00298FCB51|nr:cell death abnormality protein 1-like isoform X2 [Amyelois transitella]